jgi:hypothetical protein
MFMSVRNASLMAALALCAIPGAALTREAPAASAPSQEDTQKKLAEAQERLNAAAREVAELSASMGRRFNMQFGFEPGAGGTPPRALLGVSIGPDDGKDGAHVVDVSPGGPAAEAGIKAGDLITSIAGLELTKDSNPGRALVEKVRELEPDQKVKVAVLRDGKKLSFDVALRPAPQNALAMGFRELSERQRNRGPDNAGPGGPAGPGVRQFILQGTPPGRAGPAGPPNAPEIGRMPQIQSFELRREEDSGTRFGGVEFASLSERLGSYFGVKGGVLVVRAGVNSPFKLLDGDVILSIDGREASNAQQAGRILRSYQPGEKLALKVQRDRKTLTIDATAPGGRDRD